MVNTLVNKYLNIGKSIGKLIGKCLSTRPPQEIYVKSKVHPNTPTSPSLRTTIPMAVVEILGLEKGDSIDWQVENRDGKIIVLVSKV